MARFYGFAATSGEFITGTSKEVLNARALIHLLVKDRWSEEQNASMGDGSVQPTVITDDRPAEQVPA